LAILLSGCALTDANQPRPDAKLASSPQGVESQAKPGANVPDLSADKHEAMGDALMSRGQAHEALAHYERAAAKDPENLGAVLKYGYALLETDQAESALDVFNRALAMQPEAAMAQAGAGMAYFRRGLNRQAEAHLRKAVVLDGSLWRAYNVLGVILISEKQPQAAVEFLKKARTLAPDHPQALNNLGVAQMLVGDLQGAASSLHQAIRAGAVGEKTYNNLGIVLARLGRYDEALEAFMVAGDEAKAYNNLGCALMLAGRYTRALAVFEKAMEASPTFYVKASENMRRARMASDFQGGALAPLPESAPLPVSPSRHLRPMGPASSLPLQERSGLSRLEQVIPASAVLEGRPPAEQARLFLPRPSPATFSSPVHQGEAWGVHVSSWRTLKKASHRVEVLESMGLPATVNSVDLKGKGHWFRVLVGPYPTHNLALADRPRVQDLLGLEHAYLFAIR
jgi:Flp pilus assembly protein TadD